MKIRDLLTDDVARTISEELLSVEVTKLVNDSRQITDNSIFIAARGISSHALDHLTTTQCEMASAIVYEPDYDISRFTSMQNKFIAVPNLHTCVGDIAKIRYPAPFSAPLIGITGTNGKTSISQFIAQLAPYASIGTMGYGSVDNLTPLTHTTPAPLTLQKILNELSNTFEGAAMEVSSHALSLNRVSAVPLEIAVFTNITQDHLDFHGSMEEYFEAKAQLFAMKSIKTAIINTDDPYGMRLAKDCIKRGITTVAYGRETSCTQFSHHVHIESISLSNAGMSAGLSTNLDGNAAHNLLVAPVWGAFNAYNIVAALLSLWASGYEWSELLSKATKLTGVCGRIESIDIGNGAAAIVDYAHTPDALKNTLMSLREHLHAQQHDEHSSVGSIYTVFGCGGDRDTSKRPLMAEMVSTYSDFGIITDDNPRTEESENIIQGILSGDIEHMRFKVIPNRKEAIVFGLNKLKSGDILLIAGKGHEDYQIIGTTKTPFSDHKVVKEWLSCKA